MKKNLLPFIVFWILDSILLYLAAWFYPFYFVLGNKSMSVVWAALASGLVWTFLTWIADPLLRGFLKIKGKFLMFIFYFAVNFAALWLTARLAPVAGFGVVSFAWLAILAIVADTFQYLVWKLGNFKKIVE